jgi:isocitrate dehydrogenase (NAD+)
MSHAVTLLPGDGIGPEVVAAAQRVVEATGVAIDWEVHLVGEPALEAGATSPLPDAVVESIRRTGIALKGPVSTPRGRHGFRSVNLELRRRLGLYAQARRCRSWSSGASPGQLLDVVVIREATEDLYAGVEAAPRSAEAGAILSALAAAGQDVPPDAGLSIKWATAAATRRAVAYAFRYAAEHGRRSVVVAHKATVMRQTDGLFLEAAREVAAADPDIAFDDVLVDNLCASLVRRPEDYDVLVMPNMYGDIVSDLAAALAGGVGLVAGINVGDDVRLFEPGHGTAPAHAGRNRANPTATILSAALMLEALDEHAAAAAVERAVGEVIAAGEVVTYDLRAGRDDPLAASTDAMADAVASLLA